MADKPVETKKTARRRAFDRLALMDSTRQERDPRHPGPGLNAIQYNVRAEPGNRVLTSGSELSGSLQMSHCSVPLLVLST
jgi:hypothetical protein